MDFNVQELFRSTAQYSPMRTSLQLIILLGTLQPSNPCHKNSQTLASTDGPLSSVMAAVNTAPEPETSTKINIAESETADIDDSMADIETAPATNKDFAAADSPVTSVQSD